MSEKQEFINASEAHRIMIQCGWMVSYPTAKKWLLDNELADQPTGRWGGVLVDKVAFLRKLSEQTEVDRKKMNTMLMKEGVRV